MANPRQSVAKAKAIGRRSKIRAVTRCARTPKQPRWRGTFLNDHGQQAWEGYRRELPWLMESDRSLLEITASVRGRLLTAILEVCSQICGRFAAGEANMAAERPGWVEVTAALVP